MRIYTERSELLTNKIFKHSLFDKTFHSCETHHFRLCVLQLFQFVGMVFGGSIRVATTKLPALGWKAVHPPIEKVVEQDIAVQLARLKEGKLKGAKVSLDK